MRFVVLALLLTSAVRAADPCTAPSVKSILVKSIPGSARTFAYRFEYHPASAPSFPTLVFLPGGPGGTSIGSEIQALPKSWGYLNTDPRTVGCNRLAEELPPEALTSERSADDVIAIIRALRLKNYLLYGQSYGTLLATVVGRRVRDARLPAPRAVVLEGTVGRAFTSISEMDSEFRRQWTLVKERMPSAVRADLEVDRFPFGLDADAMGRAIQRLLMLGSIQSVYLPERVFQLMDSTDTLEDAKNVLTELAVPSQSTPEQNRLYKWVACREIAAGNNDAQRLVAGELTNASPDLCQGIALSTPFDSARYQLPEPVYYFNGERDPATPLAQARYHYDHQTHGLKVKVEVPQAGHTPLGNSLEGCMGPVWEAIANNETALKPLLESCQKEVSVENKNGPTLP